MAKYLYIACALGLTVYGQLILKSRALALGSGASGWSGYLAAMYTDLGALSGLAAALLAGVFWTVVLKDTALSFAYPFMALSFVLVPALSSLLFREMLSVTQVFGLGLIVAGITINALAH